MQKAAALRECGTAVVFGWNTGVSDGQGLRGRQSGSDLHPARGFTP